MKVFQLIFMGLLLSSPVAWGKNINPIKASYGNWKQAGSSSADGGFHITAKGFHWLATAPKKCPVQHAEYVKGSEIIKSIQESIEIDFTDKAAIAPVLKVLNPKQKYWRLTGYSKCADGSSAFIYLNPRQAIGVITAPDDAFFHLTK